MKQLTSLIINGTKFPFEKHYEASDGCCVVVDIARCEDDWLMHGAPGQSYEEFKQERLKTLDRHPHELTITNLAQ